MPIRSHDSRTAQVGGLSVLDLIGRASIDLTSQGASPGVLRLTFCSTTGLGIFEYCWKADVRNNCVFLVV